MTESANGAGGSASGRARYGGGGVTGRPFVSRRVDPPTRSPSPGRRIPGRRIRCPTRAPRIPCLIPGTPYPVPGHRPPLAGRLERLDDIRTWNWGCSTPARLLPCGAGRRRHVTEIPFGVRSSWEDDTVIFEVAGEMDMATDPGAGDRDRRGSGCRQARHRRSIRVDVPRLGRHQLPDPPPAATRPARSCIRSRQPGRRRRPQGARDHERDRPARRRRLARRRRRLTLRNRRGWRARQAPPAGKRLPPRVRPFYRSSRRQGRR